MILHNSMEQIFDILIFRRFMADFRCKNRENLKKSVFLHLKLAVNRQKIKISNRISVYVRGADVHFSCEVQDKFQ